MTNTKEQIQSKISSGSEATRAENLCEDKYGLHALHDILSMKYSDLTTLSLGYDIRSLGLQFGTNSKEASEGDDVVVTHPEESLYPNFRDSWNSNRGPSKLSPLIAPSFQVDPAVLSPSKLLDVDRLSALHASTLLYIFYTYAKDVIQLAAAAELHKRNWTFDSTKGVWFHTENQTDRPKNSRKEEQANGQYVAFNPHSWCSERRSADDMKVIERDIATSEFSAALKSQSKELSDPRRQFDFGTEASERKVGPTKNATDGYADRNAKSHISAGQSTNPIKSPFDAAKPTGTIHSPASHHVAASQRSQAHGTSQVR